MNPPPARAIAALYDIHGNLPALDAVLDDVRRARVDEIIVGGDVIPGPMPRQCLERLLSLGTPTRFVRGNGERETLAFRAGAESPAIPERVRPVMRWTAEQLSDDLATIVLGWPLTLTIDVGSHGRVLFCHATPHSDTDLITRLTPDARLASIVGGVDASLVICGHTHMQFDRSIGSVRVINAGSVGMPFGDPAARWLLLGPDVELRRTSYDLRDAADRIRRTSYPQAEEFAARNVMDPPSESAMLEMFTNAE